VFELIVVFPVAALLLSLALPVRRDPAPAPARGAVSPAGATSRAATAATAAHTTTTVASVTAAD
jgi:hypothetical protein